MPRAFTEDERVRIREDLLAAGRQALRSGGVRKTPVAWFCRQADISKGAFYKFFDGKEHLVVALLQEAEAEVRHQLLDAADEPGDRALRSVLDVLFGAIGDHPLLHLLADADEVAWLEEALGAEALAEARADDDRFFGALFHRLVERGLVREDVGCDVFAGLAPAAMALAQGERWIGPTHPDVRALLVDALVARLAPDPLVQRSAAVRAPEPSGTA